MNSTAKNLLLLAAMLIAVVLAAMLYVRQNDIGRPLADVGGGAKPLNPVAPVRPDSLPPASYHPDLAAGLAALKSQNLEEARDRLQLVPEDDPGFTVALQNLGLVQLGLDDLPSSLASYRRLAELQPENPEIFVDLAWAQFRTGRNAEAQLSLLRALELDPGMLAARYNLALYRVGAADLRRAIPSYDRAIRSDPEARYFPRALDDLLHLHEDRPELPAVHFAVAFFAKAMERRELEVEELEHFLALEPEGPAAQVARARLEDAREALGES